MRSSTNVESSSRVFFKFLPCGPVADEGGLARLTCGKSWPATSHCLQNVRPLRPTDRHATHLSYGHNSCMFPDFKLDCPSGLLLKIRVGDPCPIDQLIILSKLLNEELSINMDVHGYAPTRRTCIAQYSSKLCASCHTETSEVCNGCVECGKDFAGVLAPFYFEVHSLAGSSG